MDLDPTSNHSNSGGPPTPTNHRKERGAIAAQACESCRSRKQKCSEERPKCATCQRMNLDCKYREPQPTKKDKTLVEILDRIKSLEGGLRSLDDKVNNLNFRGVVTGAPYGPLQSSGPLEPANTLSGVDLSINWATSSTVPPVSTAQGAGARKIHYRYVSATRKMLVWPYIQQLLQSTRTDIPLDLSSLYKDGFGSMLGLQDHPFPLPIKTMDHVPAEAGSLSIPLETGGASEFSGVDAASLKVSWETMQRLSKVYFDTFNCVYPIMDRHTFHSETLPSIASQGFDEGMASTLVCLVLALGEVAIAGIHGTPTVVQPGHQSGLKGGSAERPPGLAFFNEARKRMGFNLTQRSLENVQIFALAALYYDTCCHHTESWRMTVSASLACQALLASNPDELISPRGDVVRRAFWHCAIMETYLNLEYNFPSTGLEKLEEFVGLPDFSSTFSEEDYLCNEASHYQQNFASQIVLRRLSVTFHATMTNAMGFPFTQTMIEPLASNSESAPIATLKQLALQLEHWRGMLPTHLRWADERSHASAVDRKNIYNPSLFPTPASAPRMPEPIVFSPDLSQPPQLYPYAADIQAASLRTRYYHIKYLLYRPYIFKALHHPEEMTGDDAEGVAECLRSILKWPIIMSPICFQKRLVPYMFSWSQDLLGILILLHLTEQVPILIRIRESLAGDGFETEANVTAMLCIAWIRDLKDVDPYAGWCWSILRTMYSVDDED